jgi:hypothetical protein
MQEIGKLVKTHGLPVVMMAAGLWFLNNKLDKAEARIGLLEAKLFECYEKRIGGKKHRSSTAPELSVNTTAVLPQRFKIALRYNSIVSI